MSENEKLEKIKIMALGNNVVGKTSFILRFTENKFEKNYLATVGIDYQIKIITIKEKQYKLCFYDTVGEEKYRSITLNVIKDAQGILLMYDITIINSFDSIPNWIKSIKDVKGSDFPMVLVGNKIDLESERKITKEQGEKFAKENGIEFFEISNKNGINIQEAGLALVNKILEKKEKEKPDAKSINTIVLKRKSKKKKEDSKRCC